jgi:hypothetical protein
MNRLLSPLAVAALLVVGCNNNPGGGQPGSGGTGTPDLAGTGSGNGGSPDLAGTGSGNGNPDLSTGNGGNPDLSTGTGGNPDLSNGTGGTPDMAAAWPDPGTLPPPDHGRTQHPAPPRLGNVSTTATLKAPEVWTIVWQGDEQLGKDMHEFTGFFLNSQFWTTAIGEYGVGAGKAMGVLVVPMPPPPTLDGSEFDTILQDNLGQNGWPTANSNSIFSFIVGPNSKLVANGAESCTQIGGFHTDAYTAGFAPYAVSFYCTNPVGGLSSTDDLTVSLSHEIGEAASDPQPITNKVNANRLFLGGGEIGDGCNSLNAKITDSANGKTYMVQRLYSDKIASAGANGTMDPCQVDDGPYFGAGLVSGGANPNIVTVKKGGSATFKIEAFSFDPNMDEMKYEIVGSLTGTGITFTPDIARRAGTNGVQGMWEYAVPGSTLSVTVNVAANYQPPQGATPLLLLVARSKPDATGYSRISTWWGQLQIN